MKPLFARTLLPAVAAAALLTAGCAWSVGSGQKGGPTYRQTTLGQELLDLKVAHEKGAITDEEYADLKQKLMDR